MGEAQGVQITNLSQIRIVKPHPRQVVPRHWTLVTEHTSLYLKQVERNYRSLFHRQLPFLHVPVERGIYIVVNENFLLYEYDERSIHR